MEFVPEMGTADLAEAIEQTHGLLRRTAPDEPQYQMLNEHMAKLLESRAHRAVIFSIKETK